MACSKLDDVSQHLQKLAEIIRDNDLKRITVAHMEVGCCFGLLRLVQRAMDIAGVSLPVQDITITVEGELKHQRAGEVSA